MSKQAPPLFVHSSIDDLTDITPNAMRVYMHLTRRADSSGKAWPSYQSIGDHCFRSISDNPATRKSFARRAIGELIAAGLLTKEVRTRDDGGQTSNGYTVSYPVPIDTPVPIKQPPVPNEQPPCLSSTKGNPMEGNPIEEKAAEPPAFLPDTEADRDGRFTMQLLRDTNLFFGFDPMAKQAAAKLEDIYSMAAIRSAVTTLVERHHRMVTTHGEGIQKPLGYLAKLLADDFKTKAESERVQVEIRMVPDQYEPNERIKHVTMSRAEALRSGYKIVKILQ